MDDNKLESNKETKINDSKSNKNNEAKNKSNSEIKQHRDMENTITAMLDQVMEDRDDTTNSNSNNVMNSLQFNDDESIEDDFLDPKFNRNYFNPHFDRGNKRLKTVINYPVNMPNIPIMNINQFNNNSSNFFSMRTPSFGYDNYNQNNLMFNNNINNITGNHRSSNNLVNSIFLDQSFNNQMNNNLSLNVNPNFFMCWYGMCDLFFLY